jgi:hypothetical protein
LLYARGYKQAADLLVIHIDERARDQDTLVYPILFLYRQYFELRLKHLTSDACGILDEEFVVPKTHRLSPLYAGLTSKLRAIHFEHGGGETDGSEFRDAAAVLRALDEIDPQSMTFRYPNALDGQRQIPDVRYINVRHFRDQSEQAATLLEAIDCELGALNDIKSDWLRSLAVDWSHVEAGGCG